MSDCYDIITSNYFVNLRSAIMLRATQTAFVVVPGTVRTRNNHNHIQPCVRLYV